MKLIVPCDFTKVVGYAAEWALAMGAHESELDITLLHIYERGGANSTRLSLDQARLHISQLAQEYTDRYGKPFKGIVREGSVSDTIPEVAEEEGADFVIMGTHGIIGMQKFFGSKAIKVVSGSAIPFLVVQEAPKGGEVFQRLLLPLGARPEEVEKFEKVMRMVRAYGSRVIVVTEAYSDSVLERRMQANIALLKRLFESNGVSYEVVPGDRSQSMKVNLENIGRSMHCDYILMMITQRSSGISAAFNSTDQELMANPLGLPVVCLNPMMATRW